MIEIHGRILAVNLGETTGEINSTAAEEKKDTDHYEMERYLFYSDI